MKTKERIITVIAVFIMTLICAGCAGESKPEPTPEPETDEYFTVSLKDGTEVALIDGPLYEYWKNYTERGCSQNYITCEDIYYPKPVHIEWDYSGEAPLKYEIRVSLYEDGVWREVPVETEGKSADIYDLYTGKKYYYAITAVGENSSYTSKNFTFRTEDTPRTISVTAVPNTRDIGGYTTEDGTKRIKQGIVYRGGRLDYMKKEGRSDMIDRYGIKTELDVSDNKTVSFKRYFKVIKVQGPYYVGTPGIDSKSYQPALLTSLQTFAVKDNYPIYFHCSLGRDRTGTLAAILELLLGLSETDVFKEYEISHFSEIGNMNGVKPGTTTGNLAAMLNYLKNYGTGTLQENTEQFVKDIGLTQEEIDEIRNIMLEDAA